MWRKRLLLEYLKVESMVYDENMAQQAHIAIIK